MLSWAEWRHRCSFFASAGDKSSRRPSRKQASTTALPQDRHQAQSSRKEATKGSPRPGSSRKRQVEHGSCHKGLRVQKPVKVERPSQGRKKDRRTSLKERRTPPKKEREAPRKETDKQLRKARCVVAHIGTISLDRAILFHALTRGGFHFWGEVATALVPTFPGCHM